MSDELTHVAVGRLIGEAVDKLPDERVNTPFVAAVLAFGSHALLDLTDNDYTLAWTAWKTDAERFEKDKRVLAWQVTGIATQLAKALSEPDAHKRDLELAGILGSIAPDVIDGVYSYLHPEAWQKGELLLPWHRESGPAKPMQTYEQAVKRSAFISLVGWRVDF